MDGRSAELSVKARPLKGQQCVQWSLVVVDGFVTITRGESNIIRFFEHAEEEAVMFLRHINHASIFSMIVHNCCRML